MEVTGLQKLNCQGPCLTDHIRRAYVIRGGRQAYAGDMRYSLWRRAVRSGTGPAREVAAAGRADVEQDIDLVHVARQLRVRAESVYQ